MTISPEEIERKHFLVALRGYDKDQVDAFLQQLAADYRELLEASPAANSGGNGQRAQAGPDPFDELGLRVASILRSAAEAAEELRSAAMSEAATVREHAGRELAAARQLRAAAESEAAEIRGAAQREAHAGLEAARQALADALKLRMSAEREAAEAAEAAESAAEGAQELRAVAERAAAELRAQAEHDVSEWRRAATEESRSLLEAAGKELQAALDLHAAAEREEQSGYRTGSDGAGEQVAADVEVTPTGALEPSPATRDEDEPPFRAATA